MKKPLKAIGGGAALVCMGILLAIPLGISFVPKLFVLLGLIALVLGGLGFFFAALGEGDS